MTAASRSPGARTQARARVIGEPKLQWYAGEGGYWYITAPKGCYLVKMHPSWLMKDRCKTVACFTVKEADRDG